MAKVAAVAVGGLAALALLPSLLKAPEPAPLGADVGLRGVVSGAHHERVRDSPAPLPAGVLSSVPHPHRRVKERESSQPSPPPEPPVTAPPLAPPASEPVEPPPPPVPEPPPAPADGSEEFAPH